MRRRVVRGQSWTVQEWAALSAAEQDAIFQASVLTDLAQIPPEFLASVRREFEDRVSEREMPNAS
jgi:hypothetical protein